MTKAASKVGAPSIIRHVNFKAVRVATKTHVFIGIFGRNFSKLPSIDKVECYRIGRDHYTETFIGYVDGKQVARLTGALIVAAEIALRDEPYGNRRQTA